MDTTQWVVLTQEEQNEPHGKPRILRDEGSKKEQLQEQEEKLEKERKMYSPLEFQYFKAFKHEVFFILISYSSSFFFFSSFFSLIFDFYLIFFCLNLI